MRQAPEAGEPPARRAHPQEIAMTDPIVPEIFTDGAGRCRFSGGVVRIDLVSATEAANSEKEAQTTVTHRLILSPEGFLRTVSAMNT